MSNTPTVGPKFIVKTVFVAAGLFALSELALGSWFIVGPSHRAYVTNWGHVTTKEPYQPGIHGKLPMVESVDDLRVSQDTFTLKEIDVYTKDTQLVTLQLGVTYKIPDPAVYQLLYQTGAPGNFDIERNVSSIVNDRARSVIARHDITNVAGPDREQVMGEIKGVIHDELSRMFGLDVVDVQIPKFKPNDIYTQSIERAVKIRADQLASQLERDKSRIDAEKTQIVATAQANAAIETARGAKEAAIEAATADAEKLRLAGEAQAKVNFAQAEAQARGTELKGKADAGYLEAKLKAAGGADNYVKQLQAEAQKNWNGSVPQMVFGPGSNGPVPLMTLPSPRQ